MKPENRMSEVERRIRLALLQQRKTREQLAAEVGIKTTTLGNIIRGFRCSEETKRKITQFLKVRIWRDIPVERELAFRPEMELEFPLVQQAIDFVRELPRGTATRRENIVRFKQIVPCVVRDPPSSPSGEIKSRTLLNEHHD